MPLLKDASELYLATDEDREGEAISWHLLEYLKPKVPVKRMVFHEITKSAIDHAVDNPRGIDYGLVDAAETRRILDRLYGYEVSPVLWRRVNRGLSAGRVQSPSIRLIVERERERIAFVAAGYWDIELLTAHGAVVHAPRSSPSTARKVATGKDFGTDGRPAADVVVLDEAARPRAGRRPGRRRRSRSARVEEKPYRSVAEGAVHDLDAAAGGRPQAAAVVVAGDARRPGPVRARLHHLHAHRQRRALATRRCGAVRAEVASEYGAAVPVAVAAAVLVEGRRTPRRPTRRSGPTTPLRAPRQLCAAS